MSVLSPSPDAVLLDALSQIHAEYARAERLMAELRRAFAESADPTPLLLELQEIMRLVSQQESRSAAARQAWKDRREHRPPVVQAALDRQRVQLEGLLSRINELQEEAKIARSRLAPQLDSTIVAANGHAAYGRTLGRALK